METAVKSGKTTLTVFGAFLAAVLIVLLVVWIGAPWAKAQKTRFHGDRSKELLVLAAKLQEKYRAENGAFSKSLKDMDWFGTPTGYLVSIDFADDSCWRGSAGTADGNIYYQYRSCDSGLKKVF